MEQGYRDKIDDKISRLSLIAYRYRRRLYLIVLSTDNYANNLSYEREISTVSLSF